MYLFNEGLVHMLDEIYWNMGFKNPEQVAGKGIAPSFNVYIAIIVVVLMDMYRFELKWGFQTRNGMRGK